MARNEWNSIYPVGLTSAKPNESYRFLHVIFNLQTNMISCLSVQRTPFVPVQLKGRCMYLTVYYLPGLSGVGPRGYIALRFFIEPSSQSAPGS